MTARGPPFLIGTAESLHFWRPEPNKMGAKSGELQADYGKWTVESEAERRERIGVWAVRFQCGSAWCGWRRADGAAGGSSPSIAP